MYLCIFSILVFIYGLEMKGLDDSRLIGAASMAQPAKTGRPTCRSCRMCLIEAYVVHKDDSRLRVKYVVHNPLQDLTFLLS